MNYVRTIVEAGHCIFHKIEQENDLGVDAMVELVRDERPLNRMLALQIKSGESYYSPQSDECLIPVENHYDYWFNYPLPVFGIVYVPSLKFAFWVNIKKHLQSHKNCSAIRFKCGKVNAFDPDSFRKIFIPITVGELAEISYEQAEGLLWSEIPDETYLGLVVLFRRHINHKTTWDNLVSILRKRDPEKIPPILVYFLAHIPWHGDISYAGEAFSKEVRIHARGLIEQFGKPEVIKLLGFIDPENGIARGEFGQSVEALISAIPGVDAILQDVIGDPTLTMFTREWAAAIYAYHKRADAIPTLLPLVAGGSTFAGELLHLLREYGFVDLYN